ncbi:MAG: DUF5009 domain-containing protein [Leeuwenhoekiella sp.]
MVSIRNRSSRLTSLDVFRGMTIILMIIVNNPGDWGNIYEPFEHAHWHGYTPTDLVFPSFLFIVGLTTVLSSRQHKLDALAFIKIATRALRIFSLGLFLNFFSKINLFNLDGIPLLIVRLVVATIVAILLLGHYNEQIKFYIALAVTIVLLSLAFFGGSFFEDVRVPGVLQRIAIVYFIISILYHTQSLKTLVITCITILLGYWAIMTLIPVPGIGAANLEPDTNFAAWFDRIFLSGHMWSSTKTWDPEGVLSTLPAKATGILGILAAKTITNERPNKILYLLIFGVICLIIGHLWHIFFPINKALWTSSFVVTMAGWDLVILAVLYYIIDVQHWDGWTKPFIIFGLNPIFVFFLSGFITSVWDVITFSYDGKIISLREFVYDQNITVWFSDPKTASLIGAFIFLTFWFIILYFLYKRKIIFKV